MERMARIMQMIRLDELAGHFLEGHPDIDVTYHTARDLEDEAYRVLEAALEGVEREKALEVLEAAVNYSATVENTAFAYGMKAGALLLQSLFSREELLF